MPERRLRGKEEKDEKRRQEEERENEDVERRLAALKGDAMSAGGRPYYDAPARPAAAAAGGS